MRLILFTLFVSFLNFSGFCQDIEDIFVSKKNESGMLYHLKKVELDACKKSEMYSDFTFTSTPDKDTVRLLIMLSHSNAKGKPASLLVTSKDVNLEYQEEKINVLFVDKKKKKWHTRIEVFMSEEDFKKILKNGDYDLSWNYKELSCTGSQPKKYVSLFQEFGILLEYN